MVFPGGRHIRLDLSSTMINRGLTGAETAALNGNVITLESGAVVTILDSKTDNEHGLITGGKNDGDGGGIIVGNGASLTMREGMIVGNSATGNGGGVYVSEFGGELEIKGLTGSTRNVIIYGNGSKDSEGNKINSNVYLPEGKTITVDDSLTDKVLIGVTTQVAPAPGAPVDVAKKFRMKSGKNMFISDNEDYNVVQRKGVIQLALPIKVTFDANGGQGTMEPQEEGSGINFNLPANEFTREGYEFKEWNTKKDGSGDSYEDKTLNVTFDEDTTLYAQWTEKPKPDDKKSDDKKPDDKKLQTNPENKDDQKTAKKKASKVLMTKMSAKGKNALTIKWQKTRNAKGYDIFFAKCSDEDKKINCKKVKTIKGNKTFKWTKKGLKKGTPYKAYVKAFVKKNGKKKYVKASSLIHAYTGNGTKEYTNAKAVKVKKAKVVLKKGKTFKIKAKVRKAIKGRKLMPDTHAPKLRYKSTDKSVAKVSAGGKITAKGKGKCSVYAIAHNGAYKKISVTVK